MRRLEPGTFNPCLREVLNLHNADDLKRMLAMIPRVRLKATRKSEIIDALVGCLLGADLNELWKRLGPLEQSAVAEAAHEADGTYDQGAFHAKYHESPSFEMEGNRSWDRRPTLVSLFLHPGENGRRFIPKDLREKLAGFVSKPPPAQLTSLEEIPAQAPRMRNSRRFDAAKRTTAYESHEAPLVQRLTEQAAVQDLRTTLRLIDQEKISVSTTTLFPSRASMTLLCDLLREDDFFELTEKLNDWDPEIGPMKGFSWPLLVQAAKLATVKNGRLSLTQVGRSSLEEPPEEVLRDIWDAWLTNKIIDEFSRIDTIKGQKGKGRTGFTPPPERRLAIRNALAECPVGRWVETAEFSRYMQAAGFGFAVTRNAWNLYLCDPKYGSLGYDGHGGWNILQERYLLCLLFEYAAPLGMIDIAYEHPSGARRDYTSLWGTDDLIFLSRYDGLKYFRLTLLGAFILGRIERYEPPPAKPSVSLSVLPKRQIRVDQGEFSPDELLLIESFADREADRLWSLSERKAIEAVEKGARVGEFRTFLSARDPQPLPEIVESFLNSVEQRGAACVYKGSCLLVECVSPEIAEAIARDPRAGTLCQRTGDRGLVIPVEKEESFHAAINGLGYGMPRV
jgi:hypothetical protein